MIRLLLSGPVFNLGPAGPVLDPVCLLLSRTHSTLSLFGLMELVRKMKISSRLLDVSSSLLLKVLPTIGPAVSAIVNSFLSTGRVPSYFKRATIQAMLIKANLDPALPINYRPTEHPNYLSIRNDPLTAAVERHNI